MLLLSFPKAQAQGSLGVLCLLPRPLNSHAGVRFICLRGPIHTGPKLVSLSLQGPAGSLGWRQVLKRIGWGDAPSMPSAA